MQYSGYPKYYDLPHLIWDRLPDAWFIQTNLGGLDWWERDPFELGVWYDHARDWAVVKAYERRAFQYSDPRAVFGVVLPPLGSLPTA